MAASRKKKRRRRTKAYHHGNLPVALRDVGVELIAQRGVDGFTLREVARRVGVTHVAAYRHYADRHALLAAVAEHGFRRLRSSLETARRNTPAVLEPRLRALLSAYLQFCWREPALTPVMFGPRLSSATKFPTLYQSVLESLGIIEQAIAELAPPQVLRRRSARQLGIALWTFVHGFSVLSHDKRAYPSAKKAARAFDDMLTPMLTGMFGPTARRPSARKRSHAPT